MSSDGDIDGGVVSVLERLGFPFPGGDSDRLRDIAGHWSAMAQLLSETAMNLDRQVTAVTPSWTDAAYEALTAHWAKQCAAMTSGARTFDQVAKALDGYANEIDEINDELVDICSQIPEMKSAAALLRVVTGGASDAIAEIAHAEWNERIAVLIEQFRTGAETVGELLEKVFGMSEKMAEVLGELAETPLSILGTGPRRRAHQTGTVTGRRYARARRADTRPGRLARRPA